MSLTDADRALGRDQYVWGERRTIFTEEAVEAIVARHVAAAVQATTDRDELRRAITAYVCNVSNLPKPLQVPALGLNMTPLIDGLVERVTAALAGSTDPTPDTRNSCATEGAGPTEGEEDGKQGGVHPDRTRNIADGPDQPGVHAGSGVLAGSGLDPEGGVSNRPGRGLTAAGGLAHEPARPTDLWLLPSPTPPRRTT